MKGVRRAGGIANGSRRFGRRLTLWALAAAAVMPGLARGETWPQWQGPRRDNVSRETGLLKQWPEEGPKLVWQVDDIGVGFSSVAVVGGKVYITGDKGDKLVISAFDLDGKLLWQTDHGAARGGPEGSRATPVIDNGNLYLLNGHGLVGCYDAANGEQKWSRQAQDFGGRPGGW